MALQYPLVNGVLYDYAAAKIKLDGQVYVGISAVNFEDAVTRGYLMGTAQVRLGKTQGTYEPTASIPGISRSVSRMAPVAKMTAL